MRLTSILLLALIAPATFAADLPSVLSSMNGAAAEYKGMTAKMRKVTYTKLVDDTDVETGQVWVRKDSKGQIALRIEIADPAPMQIRAFGTTGAVFKERINQIEEYDLKKRGKQLEEALMLGYGVSGDDLEERYDIALVGEEEVEGQATVLLALTPKDPEDRAKGQRLEMWISTATWQPAQQKITESDGDYRLASYTDMKINPGVSASDLEFDLSRVKGKPKRVKTRL